MMFMSDFRSFWLSQLSPQYPCAILNSCMVYLFSLSPHAWMLKSRHFKLRSLRSSKLSKKTWWLNIHCPWTNPYITLHCCMLQPWRGGFVHFPTPPGLRSVRLAGRTRRGAAAASTLAEVEIAGPLRWWKTKDAGECSPSDKLVYKFSRELSRSIILQGWYCSY